MFVVRCSFEKRHTSYKETFNQQLTTNSYFENIGNSCNFGFGLSGFKTYFNMMLNWQIEALALELNYVWKIARNVSETKTNLFVRVSDGKITGIGEAAPNIRYHETPEILARQFDELAAAGLDKVRSLEDLLALLDAYKPVNALRFAVESAYIHFICQSQGLTVPGFLGMPEPLPLATTFSLPIMEPGKIAGFIAQNKLTRFEALKVKVNRESGLEIVQQVAEHFAGPLLIDGNEAWTEPETLLVFLEKLTALQHHVRGTAHAGGAGKRICLFKAKIAL